MLLSDIMSAELKFSLVTSPVNWNCRIYQLHLCREVIPLLPMSVLDMTLNNLMARLKPWRFEEYGVPLHCYCSQVHSNPE